MNNFIDTARRHADFPGDALWLTAGN
jgi:hypothetical protein